MEYKIEITAPSAGWQIRPKAVYETPDAIVCLFELERPKGMAAQVISKIQTMVAVPNTGKPIKRFVLGKTWNWNSDPEVAFIDSVDEIAKLLESAKRIDKPRKS